MPERHRLFVAIPIGIVAGSAAAAFAPWELSVLAGWDVRTLVGHLLMARRGLFTVLATRGAGPAIECPHNDPS